MPDTASLTIDIEKYLNIITMTDSVEYSGKVFQIIGLAVESYGPAVQIGEVCEIFSLDKSSSIIAEVVGFKNNRVILMPFGDLGGIGPGSHVVSMGQSLQVAVGPALKGCVLDGLGNPIDGNPAPPTTEYRNISSTPPNPLTRERISAPLSFGVKAIDTLLTCGKGQRIGIFAGSGVGKSTLLGMIARGSQAHINVITLVGERGREVRDFIEKDLQAEGLERSVLVIATSDQPALVRLKAALVGTTIAEYFRDQGLDVMLLMDSVTRFAMAQREVGMSVGEPPVARGYTPSVFSILPKLLERSGTSDKGTITALYTVLVDGDDMNEPIADAVRGILDGHIVLSRELASRNHYPAIDVLQSISRLMSDIVEPAHKTLAGRIKNNMATYRQAQDLINIGAYAAGSSPEIDEAIKVIGKINGLLQQKVDEKFTFEESREIMQAIYNSPDPVEEAAANGTKTTQAHTHLGG